MLTCRTWDRLDSYINNELSWILKHFEVQRELKPLKNNSNTTLATYQTVKVLIICICLQIFDQPALRTVLQCKIHYHGNSVELYMLPLSRLLQPKIWLPLYNPIFLRIFVQHLNLHLLNFYMVKFSIALMNLPLNSSHTENDLVFLFSF